MLNFFNYLSLRAQRPTEAVSNFAEGDITGRLRLMVSILSDPVARELTIRAKRSDLAKYCGVSEGEMNRWIAEMMENGVVFANNEKMMIPSREKFLE
ncbi:MAG: hypothetical protein K2J82_05715 [Muribaculaceae bacterium]|nr:hypothetical protein [Muribaculaceae bacterium]